jgi:phosphatidylserine/phosphatidylglycerophosphate/cardiolipin synthase-like enzyme
MMVSYKQITPLAFGFLLLTSPCVARDQASSRQAFANLPAPAQVAVCFVPAETCVSSIVDAINAARSTIRVQAYGFTSAPILKALVDAKKRGVDVAVILDKVNQRKSYTGATFVSNAGIPVWIDSRPAIAHNKIIIIDGHLVIGGSYNYSQSAEQRNAENVTFIDSIGIAAQFTANWESRKILSNPFQRGVDEGGSPGSE